MQMSSSDLERLGDEIAELSAHLLRAQHEAAGLQLDPATATPDWFGERLDVAWAIDVLHPLAGRPVPSEASAG
jgi:hypothetical protein